jgi:hypothetical protein
LNLLGGRHRYASRCRYWSRAGGTTTSTTTIPGSSWNHLTLGFGTLVLGAEVLEIFVGMRHSVSLVMIILPSFESFSSTEHGSDVLFIVQTSGVNGELSKEAYLERE